MSLAPSSRESSWRFHSYLSSEYWQSQAVLSLNILLTMLIVSPFVGSLLKSLHAARDMQQQQASTDALTGLLSRMEMSFVYCCAIAAWKEGER